MHKPCLAQHAAFLVQQDGGDASWLRVPFYNLQTFLNTYRNHHRHPCGLYFWQTDCAIGVDNDPCTYFRPPRSSGSIYLNGLMYRELLAAAYLAEQLNLGEVAAHFRKDADDLKTAVQEHCWDEWLGFFYSVDLNLLPVPTYTGADLHHGQPRDWSCLIQRIGVWSGFLALWAGIATPDQAQRIVDEHYRDERTFNCPAGVRTLSRMEKMYNVRASGNPSSWLGPVWGVANYLTFRGFVRYGLNEAARDLAEKTVRLFGRDLQRHGALHEYYQPDNGEPILNPGFQNWNYLVLNMIHWLEGRPVIEEF
jgi:putative isomerase